MNPDDLRYSTCLGCDVMTEPLLTFHLPLVILANLPPGTLQPRYNPNNRINGFSLLHVVAMLPETPFTELAIQALVREGADPDLKVRSSTADPPTQVFHPLSEAYDREEASPLGNFLLQMNSTWEMADFSGMTAAGIAGALGLTQSQTLLAQLSRVVGEMRRIEEPLPDPVNTCIRYNGDIPLANSLSHVAENGTAFAVATDFESRWSLGRQIVRSITT